MSGTGVESYTFDKDVGDKSACNGPCAANRAKDAKPGDKSGDGFNSVWHVAKD